MNNEYKIDIKNNFKSLDSLENYVKKYNKIYTIVLIILFTIMMAFIIFSRSFDKNILNNTSICLGLLGALLLGISTIYSSTDIIELSKTKFGFNNAKAKQLLTNKLLSGIGTILIIGSLLI